MASLFSNLLLNRFPQYEIPISLHQDRATRDWWFMFQDKYLGYGPGAISPGLAGGASSISWGSQVFGPITEIVGSGYFQQEGFGKSVYVSQIKVLRK